MSCILRTGAQVCEQSRQVCPGRITSEKNVLRIETVLLFIFEHPSDCQTGIFKGGREFVFGSQTVGIVDHRESALCHGQPVVLIALFVAVHPSASVNKHKNGKTALCVFRTVYVKYIHRVRPVADIVITDYRIRCGEAGVTKVIRRCPFFPHSAA
jgi:hypothetical protein